MSNEMSRGLYQPARHWVDEGGRVLASHFNYTWFENNPDPVVGSHRDVARPPSFASWLRAPKTSTTVFFRGRGLRSVAPGNVGALSSSGPRPTAALANLSTSVSTVNPSTTQRWIYDPSTSPSDTKLLSFETPVGGVAGSQDASAGRSYCGKAASPTCTRAAACSRRHRTSPGTAPRPTSRPSRRPLEFLFFDLSACVAADGAVTSTAATLAMSSVVVTARRKKTAVGLLGKLSLCSASCQAMFTDSVRPQASRDLRCPGDKIVLTEISRGDHIMDTKTFRAEGWWAARHLRVQGLEQLRPDSQLRAGREP